MAKSAKANKNPLELGDSGVQIFNGIITGEEYLPQLRGRALTRTIEEMRRSDATIHAGLMAVKEPIIAAEFKVERGGDSDVDQQAADLLEYNFTQVLNWKHTLTEILTMLDFGFSVFELVWDWRTVNGVDRIVLTKIAFRKQTTLHAWQTQDGQPGITQVKSKGELASIPDDKLVIFTHQQEGDNWEGVSILRSAYQNWYYKKTLYQIDAVKHERQALGVVKIKTPANAKDADKDKARRAAMNIRANEQAYIEEPEGYDISFMDMMASTTADPKESIAHHDRQILKNMQVQYIDIGGSGHSGGSLAASNDQRKLLEQQDQAIAEQIVSRINEKVVRTLIDLNFNVTDYPKWSVSRIGEESVLDLATAVASLTTAGFLHPTEDDEEHVRSVIHFPDRVDSDVEEDGEPDANNAKNKDGQPEKPDKVSEPTNLDAARLVKTASELKAALTDNLYGPQAAA